MPPGGNREDHPRGASGLSSQCRGPAMEPGLPSPIVLVRSRARLRSAAACLRLPWATESYSLLCQPRRRAAGTDLAAKRQDGGAGPAVGRCPCDVRHPRHLQRQPGHRVSAVARSSGTWHKPFFAALGPYGLRSTSPAYVNPRPTYFWTELPGARPAAVRRCGRASYVAVLVDEIQGGLFPAIGRSVPSLVAIPPVLMFPAPAAQ